MLGIAKVSTIAESEADDFVHLSIRWQHSEGFAAGVADWLRAHDSAREISEKWPASGGLFPLTAHLE